MTVTELISIAQKLPPDAEVVFQTSGGAIHTVEAGPSYMDEPNQSGFVKYSVDREQSGDPPNALLLVSAART